MKWRSVGRRTGMVSFYKWSVKTDLPLDNFQYYGFVSPQSFYRLWQILRLITTTLTCALFSVSFSFYIFSTIYLYITCKKDYIFLFILLFIRRFYRHSYHGLNIFKSDTNSVNIFTTVLRIGMIRLWYGGNINSNIKQLKKKQKFIYVIIPFFLINKYGSYFFTITIFYTFLYLFFTVICILSKLDLVLSKLNFPKILDLIFVLLKFCVYIGWNYFGMCN
jgi:hypothetical protein